MTQLDTLDVQQTTAVLPRSTSRQALDAVLPGCARHRHQRACERQGGGQVDAACQLHGKRKQAVQVQGWVGQQQAPVLDEHGCCQVDVQLARGWARPERRPQL